MDCRALTAFVGAYVDGELVGREREEAEAHLRRCMTCLSLVRREARLREAVRVAAQRRAPRALRARARLRIANRAERTLSAALLWAAALAAAAAAALAWFFATPQGFSAAEEAALAHVRGLPLEVLAEDVRDVQAWLRGKVDFDAHLPVFTSGARLLGARLSPLRGEQAAHVANAQASRRLSLFVFDDAAHQPEGRGRTAGAKPVWLAEARGLRVATWRGAGLWYALVGDVDERTLLSLIEQAQER